MAQRIQRFGIGQTAKVFGVLYALMGLVFIPIFMITMAFTPNASGFGMSFGIALAMPVIYGVFGFLGTALACALYNVVAGLVGGVEVVIGGEVEPTIVK